MEGDAIQKEVFERFLSYCHSNQIPVVAAAGNSPGQSVAKTYPQRLGTSENSLITVGGVTREGTLYRNTSPKRDGEAGSMTLFAPAVDIDVPSDPRVPNHGTSQAAAIVVSIPSSFDLYQTVLFAY